jgi:transcriptional regulator with XRE-family HTH domain
MDEKARIKKIMEIEGLNGSQFASEVGIPASTISHIFTGRNNLSSAVAQKILKRFRTVSPEWLISGIGTMHRQEMNSQQPDLFAFENESTSKSVVSHPENRMNFEQEKIENERKAEFFQQPIQQLPINLVPIAEKPPRKIKRIIVYFDDNSFQEFIED